MIFVSYSHGDKKWLERFKTISTPLGRSEKIEFWSDRDLKAGEWKPQIEQAMKDALGAVLLVSDNFLASDYITREELPFLLQKYEEHKLMVFWAYLEPCGLKWHPEIMRFHAMTLGELEPMSAMNDWKWKQTMVRGCEMIDEYLKDRERPIINPAVKDKSFQRVVDIQILAKPVRRDVEVLVYSRDKKWWRQACINKGTTTTRIYLGTAQTAKGTTFPVVAMTTAEPLTDQTYVNLPDHRTKAEFTLIRG